MRAHHLLALAVLATAAKADDFVTVSAHITDQIQYPNCSATDTGISSASASFACTVAGGASFTGQGTAETGLGPYGIGASAALSLHGELFPVSVWGEASLYWSHEFIIQGAQGSGFMNVDIAGDSGDMSVGFPDEILFDFFGFTLPTLSGGAVYPVPVTFGVPGMITLSGHTACDSLEYPGCGFNARLSNVTFSDAQGNVLSGVTLAPVPEPSVMLLLAAAALVLGRHFFPRRRSALGLRPQRIY